MQLRRATVQEDIQADPRVDQLAGKPEHAGTLVKMKKLAEAHRQKFWK